MGRVGGTETGGEGRKQKEGMEEGMGKGERGNGRDGTGHGGRGNKKNFNSWRRHCTPGQTFQLGVLSDFQHVWNSLLQTALSSDSLFSNLDFH